MVWTTSYDSIIRFFLIIIFIYSIEILAGFSAFAGIWESSFMRLKIYCQAVGIYESGKLFWLFRTYAENEEVCW